MKAKSALKVVFIASSVFAFGGCAMMNQPPQMTPLEIQSMQTHSFGASKDVVFRSVVSVFQDLGYSINSADEKTGFISAQGLAKSSAASKFWLGISEVTQTKATAFIEDISHKTQVRLSFVNLNRSSSAYGQSDQKDNQILDAKVYQNAFDKIENAVFVRKGN